MNIYDVAIIGAGPAGLCAGLYLARYRINALIIDAEKGRSMLPGVYRNILGFPMPVGRREYRKLGAEQAVEYGAHKVCEEVKEIKNTEDGSFELICENTAYFSKYIIFCTGVLDNWPQIPGSEKYAGIFIHSCPICAGFETVNKTVIGIGYDDRITEFAMCMLNYTDKIILMTNGMPVNIQQRHLDKIKKAGIPLYTDKIAGLSEKRGWLEKVLLDSGQELEADYIFSTLGVIVNSGLAETIGVQVNKCGYIVVDKEQKTSLDRVYAAGDVTNFGHKQIITALYEGFTAAHSIYSDILKEKILKI